MIKLVVKESPLIIGNRLSAARVARGFTVTQLANLTGISKQSISNYEKNKQTPKGEAIEKLINALGISIAFLQKEENKYSKTPFFFRSVKNLAKREREKAKIQLAWFEEIYAYLDRLVNFVPPNFPMNHSLKNRLNKVTDEDIEEIASNVRAYWGLGLGPISNMTRLLENNGALIIKMMLDVADEDAFSQWQNNNRLPVIVSVAETPSACRDRFSLAHELGHLILHGGIEITRENHTLLEKQANRFASAFLLPSASYAREFRFPNLEIFKLLKRRWKVSIKSQIFRCKELGIITEQSATNFYRSMAHKKWMHKEPLDDEIPSEQPKVIKETLAMLRSNANITVEDIARETTISPLDIEILCGLERKELDENQEETVVRKAARVINFTDKN